MVKFNKGAGLRSLNARGTTATTNGPDRVDVLSLGGNAASGAVY